MPSSNVTPDTYLQLRWQAYNPALTTTNILKNGDRVEMITLYPPLLYTEQNAKLKIRLMFQLVSSTSAAFCF